MLQHDSPMLYQGSKSEDSWYLYINTMNDSTLAFNCTRNDLQVHGGSLTAYTFPTVKTRMRQLSRRSSLELL